MKRTNIELRWSSFVGQLIRTPINILVGVPHDVNTFEGGRGDDGVRRCVRVWYTRVR